jgi:hypothetical protein
MRLMLVRHCCFLVVPVIVLPVVLSAKIDSGACSNLRRRFGKRIDFNVGLVASQIEFPVAALV